LEKLKEYKHKLDEAQYAKLYARFFPEEAAEHKKDSDVRGATLPWAADFPVPISPENPGISTESADSQEKNPHIAEKPRSRNIPSAAELFGEATPPRDATETLPTSGAEVGHPIPASEPALAIEVAVAAPADPIRDAPPLNHATLGETNAPAPESKLRVESPPSSAEESAQAATPVANDAPNESEPPADEKKGPAPLETLGSLQFEEIASPALPDSKPEEREKPHDDMALVPSSEFVFGPNHTRIQLKDFYIDRFPVTNEEYRRFVLATNRQPPIHWFGYEFLKYAAKFPVVCVTLQDALEYARWLGKRLPSEAEWEKTCRGSAGRLYPWGDSYEPQRANLWEEGRGLLREVTAFESGTSPYGCYDLLGNAMEWTMTMEPSRRKVWIVKGASCLTPASLAKSFNRIYCYKPLQASYYIGFRCVRDA
jgi:formylglycine-generating enzyme required for sulfatase activity